MADDFWTAQWIWDGGDPRPVNAYRFFRKTFFVPADAPDETVAYVCADTRYRLYVNGEYLAFGPTPSAPHLYAYDAISVRLKPGQENSITAVVNYVGEPMFFYYRNRGGFLFQMGEIVSDETWLVAKQCPWQAGAPRLSNQQGHCEYYDAGLEPQGAYSGEIDLSQWEAARVICPAEGGDWATLEPRDIPLTTWRMRTDTIRLIEYGTGAPGDAGTVAERMTHEAVGPLRSGRIVRKNTPGGDSYWVEPGSEDSYLLFDFGEEVSGFFGFTVAGDAVGSMVDMGYDETLRVGETASGLLHLGVPSRVQYADRLILGAGISRFENFSHRAFRYVRLALRGLTAPVTVSGLFIRESTYPVNWNGSFSCSDARLQKIWEIGRRTLQMCMDDRFMDCPYRERAQWVGDARIQALGAWYCFGDTALQRRFLWQIALAQHPDGHTDPVGPGEWEAHLPQPIPGFICLWVQSIWDYYELTGDRDFCAQMLPPVQKALDWFGIYATGTGGLLTDIPGWNFTDWAAGLDSGNDGFRAPVNLFYLRALQVASEMAALTSNQSQADAFAQRAERLAAAFEGVFWNEKKQLYSDLSVDGQGAEQVSQQTNSLVLRNEVGSLSRRQAVLARLFDPGLTQIASPYFSFYLLSALYHGGQHGRALAYIREKWGMMLDAGATTWWEEYHGQTSRCHAWSIGPTIDLVTHVLGVGPAEPGFARVRVAPHPCDLAWAKGIVPLPDGQIAVGFQNDANRFTLNVSVPLGVPLEIILPAQPADEILIDGEPIASDLLARRTDTEAYLRDMAGGHRFEVVHARG